MSLSLPLPLAGPISINRAPGTAPGRVVAWRLPAAASAALLLHGALIAMILCWPVPKLAAPNDPADFGFVVQRFVAPQGSPTDNALAPHARTALETTPRPALPAQDVGQQPGQRTARGNEATVALPPPHTAPRRAISAKPVLPQSRRLTRNEESANAPAPGPTPGSTPAAEASGAAAQPAAPAGGVATGADTLAGLQAAIGRAVRDAARMPAAARRQHRTGSAQIAFGYLDGAVDAIRVVHTSQSRLLDDAAMQAVRQAHYPAAPQAAHGHRLALLVWIDFHMAPAAS